jgi:choice-of-anchor B domain-containing protein
MFEETAVYDGVFSSHNIVINEETGFAYAVGSNSGGETCGGGLHMIDVSSPQSPMFAGCHAEEGTGRRGAGYTQDVQCVVYRGPDAEHAGREICVGSNEDAIVLSDVTDKANPTTLSTARYADYGYVHQGWLSEDHRYFYQNDEADEYTNQVSRTRMLVWDLTDLDDPVLAAEHLGPTGAIDHNIYVHEGLIYHSNYTFGVRILDISDPLSPREVGYFDTVPEHDETNFDGSWSTYPYFESGLFVVTSKDEGLFVLRLRQGLKR